MTSTPDTPNLDGEDLAALRAEIDELKAIPEEELVDPIPGAVEEREPAPTPSDAIGTEKWDLPVEDETLDD